MSEEADLEQIDDVWPQVQRATRDALLASCDWTQLSDVELDNVEAWRTYRQQLRDLPDDPAWPNVTFPDPPA